MKSTWKRFLSLVLCMCMVLALLPNVTMTAFAATSGTVTGLADGNIGLSFSGDADDAWSASGMQIVGSATGTGGTCGDTHYNSTLTITNRKTTTATLSFDYSIEQNSGKIQVNDKEVSSGASFTKELAANESVKVYIKSGSTSAATKITLTNVVLVSDVNTTATFVPAENGTYTVDGKLITEEYSNTQSSMTAYQVVATPADGYQFMGWYDVSNEKYISTSAKAALNVDSDCTITARFASVDAALFETGGQRFDDLNDAINEAKKKLPATIALVNDGAIEGDYAIPSKVTLLIPFDEAKTCYTAIPAATTSQEGAKVFRTLTMAEGSSITLAEGAAISVGGQYFAAAGNGQGRIVGAYGFIDMKSGSTITVGNGASLYAWGFISGDGSVTVESGGSVYEWYQILDFRGGTATIKMGSKVFPFNQYAVQNVEVPLMLYYGARETAYTAVNAMGGIKPTAIPFIGDNGLFKLASGSMTKTYDGSADRIVYTIAGEAEVNVLSLSLAGIDVDSTDYVLPFTNNMTVDLTSGSKLTVNQTAALLPGVEVTVEQNAELVVSSGKSLYIYDMDEWGGYCGGHSKQFIPVVYAPGRTGSRPDLADVKLDVNGQLTAIGGIYTTQGGANICSSKETGVYFQQGAPGTETKTYQYDGKPTKYDIPITPAKLHNANGTYTKTQNATAGDTITYAYGAWGGTAPTELTVTFMANGSEEYPVEGTMTPQTVNAKTDTALNANSFTREGYNFLNWNTAADGTGDSYADGATINLTENTTLYARWEDNHSLTKVINKKDATCTEDGYTGDTVCAICGKEITKGETIQSKGHTEVIDARVEPTCTKSGKTEGKHCSVCSAIIVAQTEVQAKGHTEVIDAAIEPTCTLPGKTEGKHCSVCNEVIIAQTEVQAKGHSWNEGEITTSPTCENAGVKTYTCTVCNATKTEAIDATGHTLVDVAEQPATCTKAGHTAGTKCSVCDAILSGMEEIPATGHTEVIDAAKAPTCTETGLTEGKHCSVCNTVLVAQEEIPAKGHTEVIDPAVAPTCTEPGKTEGKHCSVCNEVIVAQSEAPAKGHTEVIDAAVEATCTEPGKTEGKHCSVCNEITVAQEVIPAKGHTEVIDAAVEATCTEPGKTEGKHCSVCGEVITAQKEIPALGHSWGEWTVTTPASCTAMGEETRTCDRCAATEKRELAKTGHTEVVDPAVEATCTEPGKTEGKHCSVCGEVITAQKEIPALGHSWGEWTVTTPASCTATGEETRTCDRCAATEKRELAKTGHREVVDPAVEATCTATGLTEGKHCSVCHAVIVAQEVVPMKEHTVVTVPGKAATCTEAGLTDGEKCSVCGKELKAQETIKALGHSWDEGKVTTAPTYEKTGVKTYTCGICKATKTESIPQLVNSGSGSSGGGSNKTTTYPVNIVTKTEDNGTTSSSSKMASKGNMVTITVEPDRYYVVDEVIIRDSRGKQLPVKDNGDGTYTFEMPADKVMVEPTFSWVNPFVDVKNTAYYTSAVEWTLKRMITQGTTDITFTPNGSCTRAHIVTFLWRAAGSPEPESAVSFADVPAGSYYAKAVAWAVENGITLGTTDVTFSPNAACTRAQSVTFLYRASEASASGAPTFYDVAEDAYYAAAVKWATDNGITNGIGNGLFGSNNTCTRAQIVTFLWRSYMGK